MHATYALPQHRIYLGLEYEMSVERPVRLAVVVAIALMTASSLLAPLSLAHPIPPMAGHTFLAQPDDRDLPDANPGDGQCLTIEGTCTVRAAIMEANALPGPDTIEFRPVLYRLVIRFHGMTNDGAGAGSLRIEDDLTMVGSGPDQTILDGTSVTRVINVNEGVSVTIKDLTITGGVASSGPAIESEGNITLDNITVINNSIKQSGPGAIFNHHGNATIRNSRIINNIGPGVNLSGGDNYIEHTTISKNGESPCGDNCLQSGGGIKVSDASLHVTASTISGNLANYGGAISISRSTVTIEDSEVSNNVARRCGGAIYIFDGPGVVLRNNRIEGNSSGRGPADIARDDDGSCP